MKYETGGIPIAELVELRARPYCHRAACDEVMA